MKFEHVKVTWGNTVIIFKLALMLLSSMFYSLIELAGREWVSGYRNLSVSFYWAQVLATAVSLSTVFCLSDKQITTLEKNLYKIFFIPNLLWREETAESFNTARGSWTISREMVAIYDIHLRTTSIGLSQKDVSILERGKDDWDKVVIVYSNCGYLASSSLHSQH